ncbi:MAG: hypothetical protein WAQ98_02815 [Blastocatellia bacterium]
MKAKSCLKVIKIIHTIVWAIFASCIILIWVFAFLRAYKEAMMAIGVIMLEVIVLAANGWQCPLTKLAANYTNERNSNFDIYLPAWIAKHNMLIFGSLFLLGVVFTFLKWIGLVI